jgi:hypothetical protein
MPTITLTLSDAAATELVDALCAQGLYSPVLGDGSPNPETRAQFARRMILVGLKRIVREYRRSVLAGTADPTDPDITA